MTRTRGTLAAVLLALGWGLASPLAAAAERTATVVAELFTSEGCNSCPPADRLLFELRQRPGVIALAFHVDYWDYLGWKDRFARPEFTARQRAYARELGSPMVYTPQLVVQGAAHVVGSDKRAVDAALARAARRAPVVEIGLAWTRDDSLVVSIPESEWRGKATIWFVRYGYEAETNVGAGENAGRRLRHANVVQELAALGMWGGEAMAITLPWEALGHDGERQPAGFGCAIIVQPEGLGPVLGAREIDWPMAR